MHMMVMTYTIGLLTVFIIAVLPPYDSADCVECPLGARCSDGMLTSLVPVRSNSKGAAT